MLRTKIGDLIYHLKKRRKGVPWTHHQFEVVWAISSTQRCVGPKTITGKPNYDPMFLSLYLSRSKVEASFSTVISLSLKLLYPCSFSPSLHKHKPLFLFPSPHCGLAASNVGTTITSDISFFADLHLLSKSQAGKWETPTDRVGVRRIPMCARRQSSTPASTMYWR